MNLNTKKKEPNEEESPKVFDYMSDQDCGELFQTRDQLLKPSESRMTSLAGRET